MSWPTFHTQHPIKELVVSDGDMKLATLAFGWTIGFGYFVTWHAIQQTKRLNAFIVMVWGEILVCAIFAILSWLHLCGVIKYSFWLYFTILIAWALQVQFLLQIIVNRICILLSTPRERFWLKFIIATWITVINIIVICIWLPAQLQISDKFHDINIWWDRTEKCLYLVTDAILNFIFIRSIKQRLLKLGLKKYDKLVKFNEKIIAVSLAMDVLIITMMSYPNSFVYVQFHPVAYIVKLEIEMCMSKLMVKVATGTGITIYGGDTLQVSRSKSSTGRDQNTNQSQTGNSVDIRVATHTVTHTDQLENDRGSQELESRIEFDDPKARRLSTLRAAATNRQPTVVRGNHNRSQTIELEVYSPDSQARDYDSDSRSQSSKYPRSWIEEPTYTPNSATQLSESTIAIKDLDVDLERGDAFPDDDDGGATGELFRRTSKT
ncbi:unnamed protein product [Rhizoctonia solani]|uniref:Transmembrane protein n=2 Tax=Rhizoctonia solani TaxID=456999 RepID=A0A8H3HCN2_9AGAM|nr:putative transmembrane protein [Rhizoctonia solani 123E]CAE6382430.1 unnamed protein product [Rhizoctonia solani]CAE6497559.1 unnamed protein product [Rhizoctonia solani]